MADIPALQRHQLLTDFAGFKQCAPKGVYMSLAPNNPSVWWGVIFLRQGVYAGVPLKFAITFPKSYPDSPPQVTFEGPPPHALITPANPKTPVGSLSKQTSYNLFASYYPGTFSLRHGFPHWFTPKIGTDAARKNTVPNAVDIIWYIRSCFTAKLLDMLPDALAIDQEAWRLWNEDKDALVDQLEQFKTKKEVFKTWTVPGVNEDDIPIRFLEMDRDSLDTIQENMSRRTAQNV